MEYNEKLKEIRVQHGMSQEQLAELLHVTRQTVSKWEQGVNQPDIDTLKQYCTIFGVSFDEIIGNAEQTSRHASKRRKASKIIFLISTLLSIFSVLLVFILWRFVDDTIPMHWDINGNIDRYGNKVEILIYLVPLAVLYIVSLATYLTGRKNLGKPLPNLATVSFVVIFSIVLTAQISYLIFMLCVTTGFIATDKLMSYLYCLMGDLIFVVAIATHPKITPQNSIMGMRTNFTLTNAEAWRKINNVSAICMAVSALMIILINVIFVQFWVALASPLALLISAAVIFIYHETVRKQMQKENR